MAQSVVALQELRALAPRDARAGTCAILHSTDLPGFRSVQFTGRSPEEVTRIIAGASLLIGSDSGMAHVARLLRTPAMVLAGGIDGRKVHGFYPRTRVINGPLACGDCHFRGQFYEAAGCSRGACGNLWAIHLECVLEAACTRLAPPARHSDSMPTLAALQALPATFDLEDVRRAGDEFPYWHTRTDTYRAKEQVARHVQQRRMLEIGVRTGYAVAAFLEAAPTVQYVGIDLQNDPHVGFKDYLDYARTTLAKRYP